MPQAVDNITSLVEQLTERLLDLEHRVAALERPQTPVILSAAGASPSQTPVILSAAGASRSEAPAESKDLVFPPGIWGGFPSAGAIPIVGKAILGFAGAFLLRAIAESASAPKLPVLFVAILYACCWMLCATRTANRFAAATYAITCTLILSPLIWESTVRFQVLAPTSAALILAAFFALTLALSAGHDLQVIPWVATLSSMGTAL